MAMMTPASEPRTTSSTKSTGLFRTADGKNYAFTFLLVCSLFLLWGLCNGMIDILNKHFQNSLSISKTQSGFVQFANYMGYFIMAIPSGLLARRFGYKGGILVGLALIALGAFWFIPATRIGTYWAFLTGLFILATGLTCLETVANPYATVLGPPETAAARINLAQSTNGVGWILGPLVAGMFVLSSTGEVNRSNAALYKPYLLVGIVVTILLVIFMFSRVPDLTTEDECKVADDRSKTPSKPMFKRWHFVLAVAAQFFYVAAQTGVFSYFVNYAVSDTPALTENVAKSLPSYMTALKDGAYHVTDRGASVLLSCPLVAPEGYKVFLTAVQEKSPILLLMSLGGFGLFLLGRFSGSLALRFFKPHRLLAWYSAINVVTMLLVMFPLGWISVAGLLLSFLFMSIMFPTIFALGIHGLGEQTKRAGSFIVMSIVGGAIMPLFMGWLADNWGMRVGFLMPLLCFAIIAAYAASWRVLEAGDSRTA
jgi:MFS transporter, FHS family, L-fucose permease